MILKQLVKPPKWGKRKKLLRKCKMKEKERQFHERSFFPLDKTYVVSELESTPSYKKKKDKTKSDQSSKHFSLSPVSFCPLTSPDTVLPSKSIFPKTLQKTDEFRSPKSLVRAKPMKANSNVRSHDKQRSKIVDGPIKKLDYDKYKSHCHFQGDSLEYSNPKVRLSPGRDAVKAKVDTKKNHKYLSKSMYAMKLKRDKKYISGGKRNGHISLEYSEKVCDQSGFISMKQTSRIEIEGETEQEMIQKLNDLSDINVFLLGGYEDVRKELEEYEEEMFVHLRRERECRMDELFKRYEAIDDENQEEIDLNEGKILIKSGKWKRLGNKHLNPVHQNMSDETEHRFKTLLILQKKEALYWKKLKKIKRLYSKRSDKYSGQDTPNKSSNTTLHDSSQCTIADFFATDKSPAKLHPKISNLSSFQNEFENGNPSDSDDSHATLPLPSSSHRTTSEQFGGLKKSSSKEKSFNKVPSKSSPFLGDHGLIKSIFIRKGGSTQNLKIPLEENCTSESSLETSSFYSNSKSRHQFNSFNDSLVPQVDSSMSYTSEEPKRYIEETSSVRNVHKRDSFAKPLSSNNTYESTSLDSTNPTPEKDFSSMSSKEKHFQKLLSTCSQVPVLQKAGSKQNHKVLSEHKSNSFAKQLSSNDTSESTSLDSTNPTSPEKDFSSMSSKEKHFQKLLSTCPQVPVLQKAGSKQNHMVLPEHKSNSFAKQLSSNDTSESTSLDSTNPTSEKDFSSMSSKEKHFQKLLSTCPQVPVLQKAGSKQNHKVLSEHKSNSFAKQLSSNDTSESTSLDSTNPTSPEKDFSSMSSKEKHFQKLLSTCPQVPVLQKAGSKQNHKVLSEHKSNSFAKQLSSNDTSESTSLDSTNPTSPEKDFSSMSSKEKHFQKLLSTCPQVPVLQKAGSKQNHMVLPEHKSNSFAKQLSSNDTSESTSLDSTNPTSEKDFSSMSSKEKHFQKLLSTCPQVPVLQKAGSKRNHKVLSEHKSNSFAKQLSSNDTSESTSLDSTNPTSEKDFSSMLSKEKHFQKLLSTCPQVPVLQKAGSKRNHKVLSEHKSNSFAKQLSSNDTSESTSLDSTNPTSEKMSSIPSKKKHFHKSLSNNPSVSVNDTGVLQNAESPQNHKVSKYSGQCISESSFETSTLFYNSKSRHQFDSFKDLLIPQVENISSKKKCSYTSKETKNYVNKTMPRNEPKSRSPEDTSKSKSSNVTNSSFSEKDVSSILLDGCSSRNEYPLASTLNDNIRKYNFNCCLRLKRVNVFNNGDKKSVTISSTISVKNSDSFTDKSNRRSKTKKSTFNDTSKDLVVTPTLKSDSADQLNAPYNLRNLHSNHKYDTPLSKSKNLNSVKSLDSKRVKRSAHKDKITESPGFTKRKRIENNIIDCCLLTKECFSPAFKPTNTSPHSHCNNSSETESFNRYKKLLDNVPYDIII